MKKSTLHLLLLSLFCMGCAQEELPYPIQEQELPTSLSLTDIVFINAQEGYLSAGNIFTSGLVFKTNNGGQTWTIQDSFNQGVHSLFYQGQELSVGATGQQLYNYNLSNNVVTVETVDKGWWPWHSQVVLANGQVLLVGGENFGRGFIHQYNPTDDSFILKDTFNHELREIIQTPNGILHAVGYGLVLKSTDQGASWEVSNLQGDFFRGVSFPSDAVGYVVGEYGTVYKTTDGGHSWSNCRAGNSLFANPDKLLRDIAFVDENTGFLVGTGSVVWRTTDGGKTWKKAKNLDFKTNYQHIEIYNNKAYLLGHFGQLYVLEL